MVVVMTRLLFELKYDRPHPANILDVSGRLGVELAQRGDPLPLGTRGYLVSRLENFYLSCL